TITEYAPEVLKHIKEIDAYYADVRQNLDAAYEAKLLQEQSSSTILGSMSADSPTETVVWTSDIHCNGGMAGIAGWFAQKTKPAFLLDTGDLTMGGTEAEKLCVTYLPQAAGDIPIIAAAGNHDSPDITIKQMKAAGYKVLEGDVIDFNGYRILGDKDVMRSPFGTGIYQWGEESSAQQAARLATKACEQDRPVDILAIHEPVGDLTDLFVGCAKFIASGHLHKVEGPTPYTNTLGDTTITMLTGTTGGAAAGKQTVSSKLGQNATITQLVFNAETKDPLGYRLITFQPDKQVVVGDLIAL
ncbi:MAG TPA: metallophosphoesterase, partial [Candidatus Saccharimonadales bacterium]|nr:metallophosphoesterase [Candidatus Saccharimonadales bacterium]